MKSYYTAEVLADSVAGTGERLTSIAVVYPHAVHKDMLRHRNQSRVVESFRARPTERLIEALQGGEAFRPDEFAARAKGMGQGDALTADEQQWANELWESHVQHCLGIAESFIDEKMFPSKVAKQQVNFVLQDLCPLVEIVTATDWDNYFALRLDTDEEGNPRPRPEVFKTVQAVKAALDASEPRFIDRGGWHLPLVDDDEVDAIYEEIRPEGAPAEFAAMVSAGRCARVSYDKHRDSESFHASYARAMRLRESGHMSPFEQCATPFGITEQQARNELRNAIAKMDYLPTLVRDQLREQTFYCGNFRGWRSLRKGIRNEHNYGLLQAAAVAT